MKLTQSASRDLWTQHEVPDKYSGLLLGLDVGSSGLKAILLHPAEGIVATHSVPLDLFSEQPGWAEADPIEWWSAVCSVVPTLLSEIQCSATAITAVSVSGMVPAVVVVDSTGKPLRRAILQNDARAVREIEFLKEKLSDVDLLTLMGSVLSQQSVSPTILWLANNESEKYPSISAIMGSYDWIASQLGAEPHVESNWALESGLYSIDLEPLPLAQEVTGIQWPHLLDVRHPGDVVGTVSQRASLETGLQVGTLIVVGGADHVLSAYGAGLVNQGDCLVKLGGAGDILVVADSIHLDRRLYLDSHPIRGKWMPNGCMATSGSLLRWEQGIMGGASLEDLDAEAASRSPGALISLPYFLGEKTPLHDPDLRGAVIGMHLGTTRGDLHRSFLEAIAYGFKAHFDVFAEGGVEITRVRVTNGGSKSRLWRTILADVLDRELHSIINHPGASFGAAVIAGIGTGAIDDWAYVKTALEVGEEIVPNQSNTAIYEEKYQQFLNLGAALTPFSHRIARG